MSTSEVVVCVLGLSRGQGHAFQSEEGVGKSCLCYRFLHPGFDDYISEHPSILALHEFESAAINNVHFLYWGSSKLTLPGRIGKGERTVSVHVVENTVLYQDVTSKPFNCSKNPDNIDVYVKKALGQMESPGKISYWTRDAISLPDTYRAQRYPSNVSSMKKGFIVVVDVNMGGARFDAQLQRAKKLCQALKKGDHVYILAATKMESANPTSLEQLHQLKRKLHFDLVSTSAASNYNITAVFQTTAGKVLKSMQEDIPTFEQAAGNNLAFKTSAKRSFKNFTTKWVQSSMERVEDIEKTEQYRSCRSAVGKYETDRIFVFVLLEKKNQEMMVGVNDDPERRREFLEVLLEEHPDVLLYRTQLRRKIQEYVRECSEQIKSGDDVTEHFASASPRTPRLVHHFTSNGQASSGTSSPSHSRIAADLSSSSCSSPALSGVAGRTPSDSQSDQLCESFDSGDEEGESYVNLEQFTGKRPHPIPPSQAHTLTQPFSSSDTLPMAIPSLRSSGTDKEEDPGNQAINEVEMQSSSEPTTTRTRRKRSSSSTHEWVNLPCSLSPSSTRDEATTAFSAAATPNTEKDISPGRKVSSFGAEDFESGANETENQDGQSDEMAVEDDVIYQNFPSPSHLPEALSPSHDDQSSHDTSYQSHDLSHDPPTSEVLTSDPQTSPERTNLAQNKERVRRARELATERELMNKGDSGNNTEPSQQPKASLLAKPKPPPPPKPMLKKVSKMGRRTRAQVTLPRTRPNMAAPPSSGKATPPDSASPTHSSVSPTTKSVTSSPLAPPQSLQPADSGELTAPPFPLPPEPSAVAESSGDEYYPTDDEEPDSEQHKEQHEEHRLSTLLILENCNSPPPAIPKRTKNYHKVVLPSKSATATDKGHILPSRLAVTQKPPSPEKTPHSPKSSAQAKKASSHPKARSEESIPDIPSETKKGNSLPGKNRKKRFYEHWGLKAKKNKNTEQVLSPVVTVIGSPVLQKKGEVETIKLKKSHSNCGPQHSKPSLKRAPSDPVGTTVPLPPVTKSSSTGRPRVTFMNMSKRPLPQAPFAMSDDECITHSATDYDSADTMLPSQSSFWQSSSPGTSFQGGRLLPARSDDLNGDYINTEYVNEEDFPRPIHFRSTPHPLPPSSVPDHSRLTPYPLPPSAVPLSTPHSLPPSSVPDHSRSTPYPLPPSAVPTHSRLTPYPLPPSAVPTHSLSTPHPLPPSSVPGPAHSLTTPYLVPHPSVPKSLPLAQAAPNSSTSKNSPSPEYDYPCFQRLGRMMLSSKSLAKFHFSSPSTTFSPLRGSTMSKSHSTDDDYIVMAGLAQRKQTQDDSDYQNSDVIEKFRAKRSRSMEELHLYKNISITDGGCLSIMNQPTSIPLPARSIRVQPPMFVLPPRNVPRRPQQTSPPQGQPLESPTIHRSLEALLNISQDSGAPSVSPRALLPGQSLSPSLRTHPLLLPRSASTKPPISPRPIPKPRKEPPSLNSQSNTPEPSPRNTPTPTPSSPSDQPQQSPPHLQYVPKFSHAPVAPQTSISPVGTSTWTSDDDPSSNYYNVVGKSFFSLPKSSTLGEYLDIIAD